MEEYVVKVDNEGTIRWYQNGKLNRIDGPAIEGEDGYKAWCRNGKFHRIDGPAVKCSNRAKFWFINGKEYSKDEFDKMVKSKN